MTEAPRTVWPTDEQYAAIRRSATRALQDIAVERQRQIAKGWTPEHDDGHEDQSLAMAAACYAAPHPIGTCLEYTEHGRPPRINSAWPWSAPRKVHHSRMGSTVSRRGELVIAAALIVAEIERLDRLSASVALSAER